jgi:Phage integrase family
MRRRHFPRGGVACDLGRVAGFEPAASSSRSQLPGQAARVVARLTSGVVSTVVHQRPWMVVVEVTHLVTRHQPDQPVTGPCQGADALDRRLIFLVRELHALGRAVYPREFRWGRPVARVAEIDLATGELGSEEADLATGELAFAEADRATGETRRRRTRPCSRRTRRRRTRPCSRRTRRRRTRVVAAAGLNPDDWTPRELRHSFVSLLSDAGLPIEQISRLVGHSGTATTETVYRRQIRPVIVHGADVMDRIRYPGDIGVPVS